MQESAGREVFQQFAPTLKPSACEDAAHAAVSQAPADSRLLAAAGRELDEGAAPGAKQPFHFRVTKYSTCESELAALLKK